MSIFTPRPKLYIDMSEDDFIQESLTLFDTRATLEKVIDLLALQKKGVQASGYRPRFIQQKETYSMSEMLDISHFSNHKTLEIRITPVAKFGDSSFRFQNEILVDGKILKPHQIDEKLNLIYLDLRHCINHMAEHFTENQKTKGWRGLRRK